MHGMWTVALSVLVVWCVCQSLSHACAMHKWLTGSKSCFGWRLFGAQWILCQMRVSILSWQRVEKCFLLYCVYIWLFPLIYIHQMAPHPLKPILNHFSYLLFLSLFCRANRKISAKTRSKETRSGWTWGRRWATDLCWVRAGLSWWRVRTSCSRPPAKTTGRWELAYFVFRHHCLHRHCHQSIRTDRVACTSSSTAVSSTQCQQKCLCTIF